MSWHSLMMAACNGDHKKLAELITHDRKFATYINRTDEKGFSTIHSAIIWHHPECGLMLLEAGADPFAGIPGRNLLCDYVASKRILWIKLLLLYNTHYENVEFFGKRTAKEVISAWDQRAPELHVLEKLNTTVSRVKDYQASLIKAESLLTQLNKLNALPEQSDIYIEAANQFSHAVAPLEQEYLEAKSNVKEKETDPDTYNLILNHYRKKIIHHLKQALTCYSKISLSELTSNTQQHFIQLLHRLTQYLPVSEAISYQLQLANIYFTLSRHTQNSEPRQDYLNKAQAIYEEKILTFSYSADHLDAQITYFNTVAQFYLHLSETAATEIKHRYKEQALLRYKQLEATCKTAQKQDQATAFAIMIKMLTSSTFESNYAAPLSSSYPLRQRSNTENARHRNAANTEQAPLIKDDRHNVLRSSSIKL